ncbi:GAF domain-containing protein [Variovorax sp. YR216]|uniref:GAF domain-containing protein n=1 Tax=Variovorax sp. YR216 TaxID=1882828 RepID=UPI0008992CC8|nr:GAF domain-containing protein [Variovorax sp. YR216]SEB03573.1 GAF domain-containing protein [Variovorax sp. YR216]
MTHEQKLKRLAQAAHALGRAESAEAQWSEISRLAESVFGYRLLTGLVFLKEQRLMRRIFSSDETISPLGGFKATGKGPWSARVLEQGLPYIGSNEEDIRTVFSEAELLIERDLHSVLNLPIWSAGGVVGALNLLSHRHAYDQIDEQLIELVSGICVPVFLSAREAEQGAAASLDISKLDSV